MMMMMMIIIVGIMRGRSAAAAAAGSNFPAGIVTVHAAFLSFPGSFGLVVVVASAASPAAMVLFVSPTGRFPSAAVVVVPVAAVAVAARRRKGIGSVFIVGGGAVDASAGPLASTHCFRAVRMMRMVVESAVVSFLSDLGGRLPVACCCMHQLHGPFVVDSEKEGLAKSQTRFRHHTGPNLGKKDPGCDV